MRRFSTVPFKGTKEQEAELVAWLEEHKATPGVAMPALQKAQEIYGYLPIEVQRIVANTLGKPLAEIYGISTFYCSSAFVRRVNKKSAFAWARRAM